MRKLAIYMAICILGTFALACGGGSGEPTPGSISISNVSLDEGDTGTTSFDFVVTISKEPSVGNDISVNWTTVDGTATEADLDFAAASGTLTFVNGAPLSQTISIDVTGDTTIEGSENFTVVLSDPTNATLETLTGEGTILNDDTPWHVDPTSTGTEDGKSWLTAFHSVQAAMDEAGIAGGGVVWVAAATYNNGTGNEVPVVTMKNNVHLYGGFTGYNGGAGALETELSQRNSVVNVTTLDGENLSWHVVFGAHNSLIDGFTVIRGNAIDGTSYNSFGGGLFNLKQSMTISNCTFSNNVSKRGGGLYIADNSDTTLSNCIITDNTSLNYGGGIYCDVSFPVIKNCAFIRNNAATWGGGLCSHTGTPKIMNCTFSYNFAGSEGGGMWAYGGFSIIANCTFAGNSTSGSGCLF